MLHMYTDVREGRENEAVASKAKLGWVLFGENKNNKTLNVKIFSKFWEVRSYGVSKNQSLSILPEIEQGSLNILQ